MYERFKEGFIVSIILAAMISVTGCGSGGSDDSDGIGIISGIVSKGPISSGTVTVYALNSDGTKGNSLGTGTTSSDGSYSIRHSAHSGNIIIEVTGGTYKDEATGNTVANAATLRAAVTNVTGNISAAVSALTEIAVQKAGTLTQSNIDAANTLVSNMVGGVNILTTRPADVTSTSSATATTAAKDYGLFLAAVSQMVKDNPGTYGSVAAALTAIANDLSDNTIDSTGAHISSALSSFVSSAQNQTGVVASAGTQLDNCITTYTATPISGGTGGGSTATLQSISVTPANPSITAGATQQFMATGTYSDSSTTDITASVTWSSGTTPVATVNAASGLATGVAAGTSEITATSGTVSGHTTLTVTAASSKTLQSISVTPATSSIVTGRTRQLRATGTYSDNSYANISAYVTWSSSIPSVATVGTGGLATGVGPGTSEITATYGTVSGSTTLTVSTWASVSGGDMHTVALMANGTLWAWGEGGFGALGNGTWAGGATSKIGASTTWASVFAGSYHAGAVKTDGTLWTWGANDYGQLGDGTTVNKNVPTQIGTATNWASASAGRAHGGNHTSHTVARKTDGTLWAWGYNSSGQLGDGTTVSKSAPIQVGTETTWAAASAGAETTYAIKTDGTLWAWGNGYTNTPAKVGTDTNWASVSAGGSYVAAIRTDGTLWTWGYNAYSQLGNGTATSNYVPTQVGTATNWASVDAGNYHTVAIRTDGTLWAWGYNNYGQLGDGTTAIKNVPVQIGTGTTWASATAGTSHTVAIRTDGTLWAWGYNYYGQLGDGTTVDKKVPTIMDIQ